MDEDDLLHRMVDMWITIRGFAITSKWMEDYKRVKKKEKCKENQEPTKRTPSSK